MAVDLNAEQKYIVAATEDGRCSRHDNFPISLLIVDTRFQARENALDESHVASLRELYQSQGHVAPMVGFRQTPGKKVILADGFHRHAMYSGLGVAEAPVYVIDSDAAEFEAAQYAAMCNRQTLLPRRPGDVHKAICILLAMPQWWARSDRVIGEHVGVGGPVVTRSRARYAAENGLTVPDEVVTVSGKSMKLRSRGERTPSGRVIPKMLSRTRGGSTSYTANVDGKTVFLVPNDPESSREKLINIIESNAAESSSRRRSVLIDLVTVAVNRAGIPTESFKADPRYAGLFGFSAADCVVTSSPLGDDEPIPAAVGRCLVLRHVMNPRSKAVLVCYREDAPARLAAAAEASGVVLVKPEDLPAFLTGSLAPPEPAVDRVAFRERLIRSMVLEAVQGGERTVGETLAFHIRKISPKPDTTELRRIMLAMSREGLLARRNQRNPNGVYSELFTLADRPQSSSGCPAPRTDPAASTA